MGWHLNLFSMTRVNIEFMQHNFKIYLLQSLKAKLVYSCNFFPAKKLLQKCRIIELYLEGENI